MLHGPDHLLMTYLAPDRNPARFLLTNPKEETNLYTSIHFVNTFAYKIYSNEFNSDVLLECQGGRI